MKSTIAGALLTAGPVFFAGMAYAGDMQGNTGAAGGMVPIAADTPVVPNPAATSASPFSGDVEFRTNFVARGISQSQGQPSVQGEIDVNSGDGIYAGADANTINWIDHLYPGDKVKLDVDAWLGYRKHFDSGWIAKAGFQRMQFPGHYVPQSPPTSQPNFTEAFGSVAWNGVSVQLNYAVTNYAGTPDSKGTTYLNLSASPPVGGPWMLGAALGHVAHPGRDPVTGLSNSRFDYTDYKLSIARDLGSGISLALAYTWTNADPNIYTIDGYAVAGHHTWLSLEKDF